MALRSVVETCEPRHDVLAGGLTDAHFAAQLDQVVRSPERYPVYGDPVDFFAATYPTEGLRRLLTSTFGRLSGKGGSVAGAEHGVVRFQTSFGGGKTHGLIAAYHLAKGARPLAVGEFVDPDLLPDRCRVAAVVGDALDAVSGSMVEGRRVVTMWGAIAAQLPGGWEAVAHLDETRTAPGKDVWVGLFEAEPTLVIIDEVAAHMRALASSGDAGVRRQAEAMPAFLFSLFSAAAQVSTARVVITLATVDDAFGLETGQVEKVFDEGSRSARDARSVMDRYKEVLVPAEAEEIAEILRRRLFARIDEAAAAEAGRRFREFYAGLEKREVRVGVGADVEERVRRSYPFHPELVRVLDTRVGTIPEFQRTRGALRLLAESVAAMWQRKTGSPVINVADLPLDAVPVASALTQGIGRDLFAQVITSDVAGSGAHAVEIDQVRFAGTTPYASRAATTVFLHSLEHTAASGATLPDVWAGTLAPGDDPDLVEEALRLIDQSAWHFAYDSARYRFQTEPNPRKIVEDEKKAVAPSMVREELDRRIRSMFAPAGPLKTRIFPSSPADLDDRPELQLAVLHYDDLHLTSRSASPPPGQLVDMLDTFGVAGGNRTFRNGLVFLVADSDQIEPMRETVRTDLAARRIVADSERMHGYAAEVQRRLREITDKAGLDSRVAATRCYRHLFYPKADRANRHLRHHELSPKSQGEQEKNQTPVVLAVLQGIGKVRTTPISTDFLAAVAGFPGTDPVSTGRAVEGFWRNHDADLILDPTLIQDALVAGVRNGAWVYYDADTAKAYTSDSAPPAPRIGPTAFLYTRRTAEEAGLLVAPVTWEAIQRELLQAGGDLTGTELRSRLEASLKGEPTKQAIIEVLGRVLKQDEPPVVVVEGPATAASKPAPTSTVERVSLDRLTILTRDRALALGIELRPRLTGFRLEESGPAGQVFATLADKLAELAGRKIDGVEIAFDTVAADLAGLRTFLAAVPMLPKVAFEVSLLGSATFPDLVGEVTVPSLAGPSAAFRKVEKLLLDLFDKAADLTANVTLTHRPAEPLDPASETWKTIAATFVDLKPGLITVTVRGR